MKCKRCGKEVDKTEKFCPNCGNKVKKGKGKIITVLLPFEKHSISPGTPPSPWSQHTCAFLLTWKCTSSTPSNCFHLRNQGREDLFSICLQRGRSASCIVYCCS